MSQNPLLVGDGLPALEAVKPEHVVPAVKEILGANRSAITQLLERLDKPSWENFARPMEEFGERLQNCWSSVSHLHSVCSSDELRVAYDAVLPELTAYSTEMSHNTRLYRAYLELRDSSNFSELTPAQQKSVNNALRDFRLGGVALELQQKQRFGEIQLQLAELSTRFANNALDATQAWHRQIEDPEELEGIPAGVLDSLRQQAQVRGLTGYVVSLDLPLYLPVMQYASNRELRRELYTAYVTRASEQGPNAGEWDNSEIMLETLALRREMAILLGYENYAELSLATKMAESPEQVLDFLCGLAEKARPAAIREFAELEEYARARDQLLQLEAWDVPYYSELLRHERYEVSQQALRPYLPAPRVITGMFDVASKLFGVRFVADPSVKTYHPDVTFYRLMRAEEEVAAFYLDPYSRANKRGGAWMAGCRNRHRNRENKVELPVAYLVCNFTAPGPDEPSLLTHNEVTTLFHEFGHGLHHMLTRVDVAAVAGIHGVEWDAVELPSQFMENWCWQKEALDSFSGHFQTGEPMPSQMLETLLAAKNFQAGMATLRQLEFSLFDFKLHLQSTVASSKDIQRLADAVREQFAVTPVPAWNRFQHSFSHIFAGGYAAGYYSYKWAEVLSADAFARFEKDGLFNRETGSDFLREILEAGGSRDAAESFRAFRGREPDTEALLRQSGLLATAE
jgi:oligopeptidase A